jgi:hypothetical protein
MILVSRRCLDGRNMRVVPLIAGEHIYALDVEPVQRADYIGGE